jgi:hypothetical protein
MLSRKIMPTYECFGNRTLREETASLESKICATDGPIVFEEYVIDRRFEGAMGVRIVVDAPSLTRDVVDRVIGRFLSLGEGNWRADSPVPRGDLPITTYDEALKHVHQ